LARVKRKKRKFNLSTFFCETKAVQKIWRIFGA
jgi:hypothetical protein